MAICVAQFAKADVVYVNSENAGPVAPYASWETAATNLQDAIAVAVDGDQIWVAEGVYTPDIGGSESIGDRSASFLLKDGVGVYGGFSGDGSASSLEDRSFETYPTILSGDLNGDDATGFVNYEDNSLHVLVANSTVGSGSIVDGFYVTGGNANEDSSFAGSIFLRNEDGGGLICDRGSPTLVNCIFLWNKAALQGGAIANAQNSSPVIVNCRFIANQAELQGGAIFNLFTSLRMLNCSLSGNYAVSKGGAIHNSAAATTLFNCSLSGNRADSEGGAVFMNAGTLRATNCVFWQNEAGGDAASVASSVYNDDPTRSFFAYCLVENNHPDDLENGSYSNNLDGTDPLYGPDFQTPIDPSSAPTEVGDFRVGLDSRLIDRGDNGADVSALNLGVDTVLEYGADIDGNERARNGVVDLGAFESANESPIALSVVPDPADPDETQSATFKVIFNEAVTGFDSFSDVILSVSGYLDVPSGTVVDLGDQKEYEVTLEGITSDGLVAIEIDLASDISDADSNPLLQTSKSDPVAFDNPPRVVSIFPLDTGPTNAKQILFSVEFDQPVNGFDDFAELDVSTTETAAVLGAEIFEIEDRREFEVALNTISGNGGVSLSISKAGIRDDTDNLLVGSLVSDQVIVDHVPPLVSVLGDEQLLIDLGSNWSDPGASALDTIDGGIPVIVGGDSVNTAVLGTYIAEYNATDDAGNSDQARRLVVVGPPTPLQAWLVENEIDLIDQIDEASLVNPPAVSFLEKFAYNLAPGFTGGALSLQDSGESGLGSPLLSVETSQGSGELTFYYLRRVDANDIGLQYTILYSGDLVEWSESDIVEEFVESRGLVDLVRARPRPATGFTRLKLILD